MVHGEQDLSITQEGKRIIPCSRHCSVVVVFLCLQLQCPVLPIVSFFSPSYMESRVCVDNFAPDASSASSVGDKLFGIAWHCFTHLTSVPKCPNNQLPQHNFLFLKWQE